MGSPLPRASANAPDFSPGEEAPPLRLLTYLNTGTLLSLACICPCTQLQQVWAFQGKSLPAVKRMSAPVTGQTVEPERKRSAFASRALYLLHGWSPLRRVSVSW